MKLEVTRRSLELREPLVTSAGTISRRDLLEVALEDGEGRIGRGEAAPLAGYSPETLDDVAQALDRYAGVLAATSSAAADPPRIRHAGGSGGDRAPCGPAPRHAEVLERCRAAADVAPALAAVDLALWDLAGQRAGEPVSALLTPRPATAVVVNATLTAGDRGGAATQASEAREAGFRCVKAKVGIGDDAGRLAAVRAALGEDIAIRVDANGAWAVDEALAHIRMLEPVGLELVEEPVHGIDALRAVREEATVWIAMDETAAEPGAIESGVCHAVCLKLVRCGGISGLLDAARRALAAGTAVYLASTLDGPAGIAGALHAAAALGPLPPCGLATLSAFDGIEDPFPVRNGEISVPQTPGLGLP